MANESDKNRITADSVPIKRVVLFSSGVGYFGREGKVDGNSNLELTFTSEQINDLLKSLLVLDRDGGHVSGVSYASQDPTGKALKAFGIDLASHPTLAGILSQVRGIEVSLRYAEGDYTGTIVGVETRSLKTRDGDTISKQYLNILTSDGMRSFVIGDISDIKILDENLKSDLEKALSVLAKSRDKQKRAVTISFEGEGERKVDVAYILEAPVWKTSYRLMIADKPLLQGWSIVENATDSDWNDVDLSLVAGRPISFIQDLYSPIYLPRPTVEPELYAGLEPVSYGGAVGGMLAEEDMEMEMADELMAAAPEPARAFMAKKMKSIKSAYDMEITQSSLSTASGEEAGELFAYTVSTPVSVDRQSSAMIPIISDNVESNKLSIYNRNAHSEHPYNGFRLKNATGLALLAGPVTVFDDGVYAGDAQLPNMQPDEERLLSYALDLAVNVDVQDKNDENSLITIKILKGSLKLSFRSRTETIYTVRNKKDKNKVVLIEHPYRSDWELLEPAEYDERTDSLYRFKMDMDGLETKELTVKTEKTYITSYFISNLNTGNLAYYISVNVASDEVRTALEKIVSIRSDIDDLKEKQANLEKKKSDLRVSQNETRNNIKASPENSKAYSRFLQKLETQEDAIEKIEAELDELEEDIDNMNIVLEEFIGDLEIE